MKVEQFIHKNQFIIKHNQTITFQSYETTICKMDYLTNKLILNKSNWDWSNTTRNHFKEFINIHTPYNYQNKKQWQKEINQNDNIIYTTED